jgi:hypothetical protein
MTVGGAPRNVGEELLILHEPPAGSYITKVVKRVCVTGFFSAS